MADLLGSILSSMDKPPAVNDTQKKLIKKQKEQYEKHQAAEKAKLAKFRKDIEEKINKFLQDPSQHKHKFSSMSKVLRSVIHDAADIAGLTAFSFGEEEVDRYVMLFKKEFAPSEDELQAYRRGEDWNPEKAKEVAKQKERAKKEAEEDEKRSKEQAVYSRYQKRNEKRLGKEAAKDAEKIIFTNRQFGFVPSENKRDQRSIEQTLADLKARKKLKVEHNGQSDSSSTGN
ncbi:sperm-associated antigen 7 homolog [Limulus polyphemus]|uniref:Sperm-associated antigen 7 homolog n=1 Tax=Limulus polyphemus TaxID=6850 RepID=A0ABM1BIQ0_LIMPO|nr:sperm-associated antigen 7 homolog [Limulus polyphemus]